MQHSVAWLVWAISSAALALMIRNPLYLTIIALSAWLVYLTVSLQPTAPAGWRGLIKLGLMVWLLTIPFNALMIHEGNIVLIRLPSSWPLVGGKITLEAVLYGFASGLGLWTLLLIFAGFNLAVDASQLLRLLPPSLYQAGTVASIALTFVPQMIASAKEIREAQQIRGHRFRRWRDLLPLFVPLLTTSFEHAIQLAESMESRGFGGQLTGLVEHDLNTYRWRLLGGVGAMLSGLVVRSFWPKYGWLGYVLIGFAAALMIYGLRGLGRQVQRSRYTRSRWRTSDSLVVATSGLALAIPILLRLGDTLALTYYPYPPYPVLPEFDARIGIALALLSFPVIVEMLSWPRAHNAQPTATVEQAP